MVEIVKPKHYPSLLFKIPGQGILLRRPVMALNPLQKQFLENRGMVEPLTDTINQSSKTSEETGASETLGTEPGEISGAEQLILVGFFNNFQNKADALKIDGITLRKMEEIEAARPLDWNELAEILSETQIESSRQWLQENFLSS